MEYIKLEKDLINKSLNINKEFDKCQLELNYAYCKFRNYLEQELLDITKDLPSINSIFLLYNEEHTLLRYDWNFTAKELHDNVALYNTMDMYIVSYLYSPTFKEEVRYPFNKIKDKLINI